MRNFKVKPRERKYRKRLVMKYMFDRIRKVAKAQTLRTS